MSRADDAETAPSAGSPGPRVAVVIPCFNHGDFVAEAVASAREQEECEVVVVDDGSTDEGTRVALDALKSSGVRVVRQANSGPAAARMAGIRASSAPYVQVIDADDLIAAGILTKLADALEREPRASAAWGAVETFGDRVFRFPCWPGFDPWRLSFLNEVPSALMVDRTALLALGGWEANGYEDWGLALRAAEAGWIGVRLDEVSMHYREHAAPRRLAHAREADESHRDELRRRHQKLWRDRRRNRRRSRSTRSVKLVWTLIDGLPLLSGLQKHSLFCLTRDLLEPWMRPSDIPGPATRIRHRLSRSRA